MGLIKDEEKKKDGFSVSITPLTGSETTLAVPPSEVEKLTTEDDEYYPDGGWAAWQQVVAGHLINAVACGFATTFGIFQLYYTTTLELPESQVSWIGSVQTFLTNSMCLLGGTLTDAGHARFATMAGSVFVVFGTFGTSFATRYWEILLAQGICTGLGLGLVWMPSLGVVASYFKKRRSLALMLASAGAGTGSLIFPSVVMYLMPRIGFAWSVRCSGFVVMIICVLMNLLLRPRPVVKKTSGKADVSTTTVEVVDEKEKVKVAEEEKKSPLVDVRAFMEPSFALLSVATFFLFWAVYMGYFYMNTFAMLLPDHTFTSTSTVTLLLLSNGLASPSRIIFGQLADSVVGPITAYIIAISLLGTSFFVWIAVESAAGMYAWAAFFGIASGAAVGLCACNVAAMTPNPGALGGRFGLVCVVVAFATLAGPPTVGVIIEATSGAEYWAAQVWAGCVCYLSVGVLILLRWRTTGKLWIKA